MQDYGTRYKDSVQRVLEARLQRIYTEAQKDILGKLDEFTRQYKAKDKIMRQKRDKGLISDEKYERWVAGQVFMGAQWENKVKDITDTLVDYQEKALDRIRDKQLDVFTENANYQAYALEHGIGKNFGFDLYDRDTVENLIQNQPELLPRKIVDKKKHNHWNQGIINNCITQGVIQGESIPQIAARIANKTANHNMQSSTLYARTAMTSAQNAGRMQMLRESKEMGINVQKKWMSTHDGRTRDSHITLDGQIREVEKPFNSELGKIDYPGDPKADPGDVYNCRCTLVYVYPDFADLQHFDDDAEVKDEKYSDWLKRKEALKNKEFTSKKDNDRISSREGIGKPIESRTGLAGKPSAMVTMGEGLNKRQERILNSLQNYDDRIVVNKSDVSMKDLSALTAETGCEFAMFTRKGKRLIIRGSEKDINIGIDDAKRMKAEGYKWSGHTHPGNGINVLLPSQGDELVLQAFGQNIGCIWGETGNFMLFDIGGD